MCQRKTAKKMERGLSREWKNDLQICAKPQRLEQLPRGTSFFLRVAFYFDLA
jgi:hypothetical protein